MFASGVNQPSADDHTIMTEAMTCFKELPFMNPDYETSLGEPGEPADSHESDQEGALALQVHIPSESEEGDDTDDLAASLVVLKLMIWVVVVGVLAWVVYDIYVFPFK